MTARLRAIAASGVVGQPHAAAVAGDADDVLRGDRAGADEHGRGIHAGQCTPRRPVVLAPERGSCLGYQTLRRPAVDAPGQFGRRPAHPDRQLVPARAVDVVAGKGDGDGRRGAARVVVDGGGHRGEPRRHLAVLGGVAGPAHTAQQPPQLGQPARAQPVPVDERRRVGEQRPDLRRPAGRRAWPDRWR